MPEDLPPLPSLTPASPGGDPALPALPGLPALPSLNPDLAGLPPLPTIGPVTRRPPADGARRRWVAARVVGLTDETPTARTFRLQLPPGTPRHVPGQHYDVRLTAEDGSTAQRSYSIGSAPGPVSPDAPTEIELTVDRIDDGEVSPPLHDEIVVGDDLEVRGPFGGWFIWRGDTPALLLGGGSGVVPLMAMRRWWAQQGSAVPLRLLVSVRSPEDLFYAGQYGDESTVIYSRQAPEGSPRPPGRLRAADLEPLLIEGATCYVCGSAGFAEAASQLLVEVGVDRTMIRVERFGPA